jgi:hypothetical protein
VAGYALAGTAAGEAVHALWPLITVMISLGYSIR